MPMSTAPVIVVCLVVATAAIAAAVYRYRAASPGPAREPKQEFGPRFAPLACPYCQTLVHGRVEHVAQRVTCPSCGGGWKTHHYLGPQRDPDIQKAMFGILGALAGIALSAALWFLT